MVISTSTLYRVFAAMTLCISTCWAENSHLAARSTSLEIDQLMMKKYQELQVEPEDFIDDPTFLRRSYVSIIGRIPTPTEATNFFQNPSSNKRHELIDTLLDSPGYNHQIFNMYADMLRLKTNFFSSGVGWHLWLKDAVSKNKPYDELVYEMLSADGHMRQNPAVGYYLRDPDMLLDNVSNTVQVFLGTQIGCAQCHDDPFEDTTQMQYYQLAAFSSETVFNKPQTSRDRLRELQLAHNKSSTNSFSTKNSKKKGRKKKLDPAIRSMTPLFRQSRRSEITTLPGNKLQLPHDYAYNDGQPNQDVEPQTLFGNMPDLHAHNSPKAAFASWVTSPDNPMFTKTIVNRLWAKVFGYGLAEPLDNWTPSTKASHPATLALLEKVMQAEGFDVKETLRVMYHTALFQREVTPEEIEPGKMHHFSGPVLRRLSAEEIYDSQLTIEHGNLDHKLNNNIHETWQKHLDNLTFLFEAPLEEISAVASGYKEYEKRRYTMRSEFASARLSYEKAKTSGDQQQIDRQRQEIKKLARKRKGMENQNEHTKTIADLTKAVVRSKPPRTPLRSAELPTPHRPGSIIRQFGGSDRETSDAGHTRANIPQVLSAFNGPAIGRIADKKGRLAQLIRRAKTPQQRLEAIFLSIYTNKPSAAEQETLLPMMEQPEDIATVIRAMLTSKRFLFLQ